MGRLVDVDDIIKKIQVEIKKSEYSALLLQVVNLFVEMLEAQPTAYDIEKVVEQLEELPLHYCEAYWGESIDLERAIDVVRKGGVDGC